MTRHSHPLALRQIHTTANCNKYSFFPMAVVYWNSIPSSVVTLPTLNQFSAMVRSLDHKKKNIKTTKPVFSLFLTSAHDLLTLSSVFFFFHKLCTMAARRNPPAHNPREGAVPYIKKERNSFNSLCNILFNTLLARILIH